MDLALPADEPREASRLGHFDARSEPPGALQLEDANGRRKTFDNERAEITKREVPRDEGRRALAHVHAPRIGELFEPRGEAHGFALRRVVHAKIVADLTHHDLARMDADPHREGEASRALHVLGIAAELAPARARRVAGSWGVILVGNRRAEQRHDAVPGVLVDRSLEPMDAVGKNSEETIQDRMPVLWVDLRGDLHRSLHVGEEHRHLFTLTLQGGARREDLLGEVLRSVGAGIRGRRRSRDLAKRFPALTAELDSGGVLEATA